MITIETTARPRLPDEDVDGFDYSASTWRFDADRYGEFIAAVTGIDPGDDLSATDCYRLGNRIEAFIDERRRRGEWTPALLDDYPDVDSLEQVHWLARFFRHCHEACVADSPCR
jgi:hypothetical protein